VAFFDRWFGKARKESRKARAARDKELAGDLLGAIALFEEAELPDEVARLLLLRADAEKEPDRRIVLCARAAEVAVEPELKTKAKARKALLAFDVLKARGAACLKSDVLAVAKDLEEAEELERAADAFAMAGDDESEVRVLTAAGAIERLEDRLRVSETETRARRESEGAILRIEDLDRGAERREAIECARALLRSKEDERVRDMLRQIRAKLVRGPLIDLEIDGAAGRFALGPEVTIGRGDATIVVPSRAVSRRHVRVFRKDGVVLVEDLGTRNGTTLAGARISGPIPIGGGVRLALGAEVPCLISEVEHGVAIEVASARYIAPLGPLLVSRGAFAIDEARTPDDAFVSLTSREGGPRPFLGELQLAARIELAIGDAFSLERGGAARLRVLAGPSQLRDEDTGPGLDGALS
jgi:hypothetical protein